MSCSQCWRYAGSTTAPGGSPWSSRASRSCASPVRLSAVLLATKTCRARAPAHRRSDEREHSCSTRSKGPQAVQLAQSVSASGAHGAASYLPAPHRVQGRQAGTRMSMKAPAGHGMSETVMSTLSRCASGSGDANAKAPS